MTKFTSTDEIKNVNLTIPPTTDSDKISASLKLSRGMTIVFLTYQSLDKVSAAKIDFDLIICDEAHRTTDSSKDSSTQFTAIHDKMYMTATPRLYTSDAKYKAAVNDITLWSMDNATIFSGIDIYNNYCNQNTKDKKQRRCKKEKKSHRCPSSYS